MEQLYLHEEILLLALKDKAGTIFCGAFFEQAICGAAIAELILNKSIKIEKVKKKNFVRLISSYKTGNKFLDECLEKIAAAKKDYTIETCIQKLTGIKDIKHKAAASLVDKNILEAVEDKILFVFNRTRYPEVDHTPEQEIIRRIEKAIFEEDEVVDERTTVIIALANATDLLKANLDKKKLTKKKDRIKEIVSGNLLGDVTKELVEAIQAVILLTAILPAVFAATTVTSTT